MVKNGRNGAIYHCPMTPARFDIFFSFGASSVYAPLGKTYPFSALGVKGASFECKKKVGTQKEKKLRTNL